MDYTKILYSVRDGVARIALNDPDALNASSEQMGIDLVAALDRARREARAVLLTGEGKAFCSGVNLSTVGDLLSDPNRDVAKYLERYFNPAILAIKSMEIPVVTAVRGPAAGIGCGLAMAGDLIVCGESGYFFFAFRHVGLVPDGGISYFLARSIGRARAMELMLLGGKLKAQQALDWGLINRVVPDEDLEEAAFEIARELAAGARSLGMIKQLAWAGLESSLETALASERINQREASRTDDFVEGVTSFREKRKPQFKGR